jgi:hypothetical protein
MNRTTLDEHCDELILFFAENGKIRRGNLISYVHQHGPLSELHERRFHRLMKELP